MNARGAKQGEKSDQHDDETKDEKAVTPKISGNKKLTRNRSLEGTKNSRAQVRRDGSSRSRSRSRSRQTRQAGSKRAWKSANAWLNFMQHFRENLRGSHVMRSASIFRLASEQWSEMSSEEKKPYVDAANKVKRKKQLENDYKEKSKKESKKRATTKEPEPIARSSNQKKRPEQDDNADDADEDNDNFSDSEYNSEEEDSTRNFESDNASLDTDGSV